MFPKISVLRVRVFHLLILWKGKLLAKQWQEKLQTSEEIGRCRFGISITTEGG